MGGTTLPVINKHTKPNRVTRIKSMTDISRRNLGSREDNTIADLLDGPTAGARR